MRSVVAGAPDRMLLPTGLVPAVGGAVVGTSDASAGEPT